MSEIHGCPADVRFRTLRGQNQFNWKQAVAGAITTTAQRWKPRRHGEITWWTWCRRVQIDVVSSWSNLVAAENAALAKRAGGIARPTCAATKH